MYFATKHLGLDVGRQRWSRPVWYRLALRIGLGANEQRDPFHRLYRYELVCDFQILPNFLWWREVVEIKRNGDVVTQDRIVGIQSWPFYCKFRKPADALVA